MQSGKFKSARKSFCWLFAGWEESNKSLLCLDDSEEVLCFRWIDRIAKKMADGELTQRFSPRRKRGNRIELNKERVRRL